MSKNNKSFVEIKENNDNQENIINPLEQYKYIEPKKKPNIKKIFLIIFSFIAIILLVILFKITSDYSNKNLTKEDKTTTENSKTSTTIITTTTTIPTTENINQVEKDTLKCYSKITENNIEVETEIIINFDNNKLRSDFKTMNVNLLNENSKEYFNNYVKLLEELGEYLKQDEIYELSTEKFENKYIFKVKTTYKENQNTNSTLNYDENYSEVKTKMEKLDYECN